ncbi:MAG: hypothetical protein LBC20_00365 [Planctomycetaceae bacterium]|nr:hypothetical protein [Planctomycetaceae bacterium]
MWYSFFALGNVFLTDVGAAIHGDTNETLHKGAYYGKFHEMFRCVFGEFLGKNPDVRMGKQGKAGGGGRI